MINKIKDKKRKAAKEENVRLKEEIEQMEKVEHKESNSVNAESKNKLQQRKSRKGSSRKQPHHIDDSTMPSDEISFEEVATETDEYPRIEFETKLIGEDEVLPDLEAVRREICHREAVLWAQNHYPGKLSKPEVLAVVGSESGSYDSISKLLRAGFRCAPRLLALTPWGNYVVFRSQYDEIYTDFFLFEGCTCNVDRCRYLDLSYGTAGLLYFTSLHDVIRYIIDSCKFMYKLT